MCGERTNAANCANAGSSRNCACTESQSCGSKSVAADPVSVVGEADGLVLVPVLGRPRACRRSRSRRAARPRRRPDRRRARRVGTRGSSAHLEAEWLGGAMSAGGSTRDCDVVVLGLGPGGEHAARKLGRGRARRDRCRRGAGRRRVPVLGLHAVQADGPARGPDRRGAPCGPARRRVPGVAGLVAGRGADPGGQPRLDRRPARRAARARRRPDRPRPRPARRARRGPGREGRRHDRAARLPRRAAQHRHRAAAAADRRAGGHAVLDQPRDHAGHRGPRPADRGRRRTQRSGARAGVRAVRRAGDAARGGRPDRGDRGAGGRRGADDGPA